MLTGTRQKWWRNFKEKMKVEYIYPQITQITEPMNIGSKPAVSVRSLFRFLNRCNLRNLRMSRF